MKHLKTPIARGPKAGQEQTCSKQCSAVVKALKDLIRELEEVLNNTLEELRTTKRMLTETMQQEVGSSQGRTLTPATTGGDKITTNLRSRSLNLEEDEELGDKATKASVLYSNIHKPHSRTDYASASVRERLIKRAWKCLSPEERKVFVVRARQNKKDYFQNKPVNRVVLKNGSRGQDRTVGGGLGEDCGSSSKTPPLQHVPLGVRKCMSNPPKPARPYGPSMDMEVEEEERRKGDEPRQWVNGRKKRTILQARVSVASLFSL